MKKLFLLGFAALLISCQNPKIEYNYPQNPENIRKQRAGKFFDNSLTKIQEDSQKKPVNQTKSNALWLASIEVISALLPISVVDEKSGLIVTEWYADEQNKNERIKINLLVKGKEIKQENLALTIFKQKRDGIGNWHDETSSGITAKLISGKIIEKAQSYQK
ncbi:MAG: hypothetical protein K0R25_558 [Rickettsiaceae bacterium]|jgi:hypothetical protein|nr:hypothetical protein [Rickettsiaceae bacterium]